jgi:hypothetical protein
MKLYNTREVEPRAEALITRRDFSNIPRGEMGGEMNLRRDLEPVKPYPSITRAEEPK